MAVRLIVGVVLSAVVLMAWGFVFWMALPFGEQMVGRLPPSAEAQVVAALKDGGVETGTYFSPHCECEVMSGKDPEALAAFTARHEEGPLVQVIYRKEGVKPMGPATFAAGFGHLLAASLLAGLLLVAALPSLPSYPARVLFVAGVGVFASVAVTLGNPIWMHHPWKFALMQAGFDAIGWLLAGAALGLVVRPKAA